MRLAGQRQRSELVCTCRRPQARTVTLFGFLELADVYECAECGRPIMHPETRDVHVNYQRGTR